MLRITVDMFSGLPNPTQVVEATEQKKLMQEIARNQPVIAAMTPPARRSWGWATAADRGSAQR
jgi:hypothetical protein